MPAQQKVACEVCGAGIAVKGTGRPPRYCRQACRQEAYRRRRQVQELDDVELHRQLAGQLDRLAGLDWAAARQGLGELEATVLVELHRHLDAALAPLVTIGTRPQPSPAPAAALEPASVTGQAVTEPAAPAADPLPSPLPSAVASPPPAVPEVVGGLRPTEEQAAIITACAAGKNLVIEAVAGSGKTSTLKMAATQMRGRGLYIAFNKAIAIEAKRSFPANVTCSTAHALAFRAVGHVYKQRLDGPRLPARQTARLLGIDTAIAAGERRIDPPALARLATDTVTRYCRSADDELGRQHVPPVNGVTGTAAAELAKVVLELAREVWADLRDPGGRLKFNHDVYLKLWALSRPQLDADYVLFDEAQDADPVTAAVVQAQTCQRLAVGDSNQSIYAWRGAIDALRTWPADARLTLTQSWRFGPAVAAEANKWLELLGTDLRVVGTPHIPSRLGELQAPDAVLCRTNATAITQAMAAMDDGRRAALVGGGSAIKRLAQAALDLQAGRSTDHPELFAFHSWQEVRDYVRDEDAGADLATLVRLVDDIGASEVIGAADRLSHEDHADVVISTAHKAKGREWPTVQIARDFRQPRADQATGQPGPVDRGEAMLAYVSVTRAREVLDRGGLAWIDAQLAGVVAADPEDEDDHHRRRRRGDRWDADW